MKRITTALLAVAVLAGLVASVTTTKHNFNVLSVVHASNGCTNASLMGNYALIWSGFTSLRGSRGPQVPWAGAGVGTFDGGGGVSANYSTSVNGSVYTAQTGSGTYTVNSDCTASVGFTQGDAAGLNANMVIIGGGTEALGTDTSAGDTMSFDLKQQ
jgi:hypothetical protein